MMPSPWEQAILDELAADDGQNETELKMHLGQSQRSSLLGTLQDMAARKLVRCDASNRWWLQEPPS
jgi:DNA-binding IclR family transcriptional regulator